MSAGLFYRGTNFRAAPLRCYVFASVFAGLTAVGAFLRIPIPYVPFTLQDLFVLLSGAVLGPAFGFLSQMLYLTLGLLGLPIFANGGGPGYIFQPTFGYLLGFPIASMVVGVVVLYKMGNNDGLVLPSAGWFFLANLVGYVVIFTCGVLVLYANMRYMLGQPRGFIEVVKIGCLVFLPASAVKAAVAAYLAHKIFRIFQAAQG